MEAVARVFWPRSSPASADCSNPEVEVLGAKCDPARVPFGVLRELIEQAVNYLDRAAEPERSATMTEIKRSVGGSGPLLARFSPRLGDLMGVPQVAVEGADDSHAQLLLGPEWLPTGGGPAVSHSSNSG